MGGIGSGKKKLPGTQLREAIDSINVPEIVKNLRIWAQGKPVMCPYCAKDTGARTADTVALQSAIELLNRRLGKPVQHQTIDITQTIQLSADQIDTVIQRHLPQIVQVYEHPIRALMEGHDKGQDSQE